MMIMELADFNPTVDRQFRWGYSYNEILKFYQRKEKKFFDRFIMTRDCVVELVNAILGGKKKDDELGLADASELELSDEQIVNLRNALGKTAFATTYPQYEERVEELLDKLANSDSLPTGGTSLCSDGSDSLEEVV